MLLFVRCHLPSGKTYWLCEKHQEGPRITRLTTESASRDEVRRVLFEEDVRLKELLEKSKVYKEKKSQASKTKHITLPEKGFFIFFILFLFFLKGFEIGHLFFFSKTFSYNALLAKCFF